MLCVEASDDPIDSVQKCAEANSIDYTEAMSCAKGDRGVDLIQALGKETSELQPPHQFVPWITINGQPQIDPPEAPGLIAAICKAYNGGGVVPHGCKHRVINRLIWSR
jgi:interferon, gamma-inducible protein 30